MRCAIGNGARPGGKANLGVVFPRSEAEYIISPGLLFSEMGCVEGPGERVLAAGRKVGSGGRSQMIEGFVSPNADVRESPFSVSGLLPNDQRT